MNLRQRTRVMGCLGTAPAFWVHSSARRRCRHPAACGPWATRSSAAWHSNTKTKTLSGSKCCAPSCPRQRPSRTKRALVWGRLACCCPSRYPCRFAVQRRTHTAACDQRGLHLRQRDCADRVTGETHCFTASLACSHSPANRVCPGARSRALTTTTTAYSILHPEAKAYRG